MKFKQLRALAYSSIVLLLHFFLFSPVPEQDSSFLFHCVVSKIKLSDEDRHLYNFSLTKLVLSNSQI